MLTVWYFKASDCIPASWKYRIYVLAGVEVYRSGPAFEEGRVVSG